MPVAGFNLTKISAERIEAKGTQITVENNITIKSVEEIGVADKSVQKPLKFSIEFTSKFQPNIGNIMLYGDIIFIDDDKKIKDILKEWKKDKRVNQDVFPEVLNAALNRCNIEAILLSKELNLPSPVPLPKANVQRQN